MGRYSKFKPIKNLNPNVGTLGDLYYKTVFYPEVEESEEDIYVITDFGDRLDLLANQFYNDVILKCTILLFISPVYFHRPEHHRLFLFLKHQQQPQQPKQDPM